jgi:Spy/CpxP family protein refolding chaperone
VVFRAPIVANQREIGADLRVFTLPVRLKTNRCGLIVHMIGKQHNQEPGKKHRFRHPDCTYTQGVLKMKNRIMVLTLAAGLAVAGAASAADRGPRMDRQEHRGGQEFGLQVIQHLGKAIRRLDLSDDQKAAIRGEFGGVRESIKPLVQELHAGRLDLRDVITGGEYDAETAAEIAEQQGQLTTEITLIVSGAVAGVLAHLDDEQRTELQAMGEERRVRKEEHREDAKARRHERKEERRTEPPEGN